MSSLCSNYRLRMDCRRYTRDTNGQPGARARGMLITALLIQALPGLAGADYVPTTVLGSVEGMTENQQRTGDAVQTVCGQFIEFGTETSEELDLFERCGSMVQTAVSLESTVDDPVPTPRSLGLDEAGLAAAVQTVATEELAATKSMATEMSSAQRNAGIARLNTVRGGNLYGAVGPAFNPFVVLADTLSNDDGPQQIRGGAAGDSVIGNWGMFANLNLGFGDRDGTDNEDGFDFDKWGINVGGDYRINDNTVLGGIISYASNEADFDSSAAVPGGGVDSDSWGISLYGTHYTKNFYVDGLLGYTNAEYDISRQILLPSLVNPSLTVVRKATGDTDSDGYTISIGAGMDLERNNVSYGPFVRLTYQNTEIDGYSETGAFGLDLTVGDQEWESFTSVIGARSSYPLSQSWGVLTPQVRVGWVHEFDNDSQLMSAFYTNDPRRNALTAVTDDPDRNYFELGLGISAAMQNGLQAFFDYQTLLGHRYVTDHTFTIGVRKEL